MSGLTPEDWERPTLLQPPEPEQPPWTVLQLAAHFNVFMGLTMSLVGEPESAQPVVERASFYISVSDRSKVSPSVYQHIVDHAKGHTPATILDKVRETFDQAFEAIRTTPPDNIGPGFFGPMHLEEVVAPEASASASTMPGGLTGRGCATRATHARPTRRSRYRDRGRPPQAPSCTRWPRTDGGSR